MILLMYSASELDCTIGRNAVFTESTSKECSGRNFDYDKGDEVMVTDKVSFSLKNYDLQYLAHKSYFGVGHTDYRANLLKILEFIE